MILFFVFIWHFSGVILPKKCGQKWEIGHIGSIYRSQGFQAFCTLWSMSAVLFLAQLDFRSLGLHVILCLLSSLGLDLIGTFNLWLFLSGFPMRFSSLSSLVSCNTMPHSAFSALQRVFSF